MPFHHVHPCLLSHIHAFHRVHPHLSSCASTPFPRVYPCFFIMCIHALHLTNLPCLHNPYLYTSHSAHLTCHTFPPLHLINMPYLPHTTDIFPSPYLVSCASSHYMHKPFIVFLHASLTQCTLHLIPICASHIVPTHASCVLPLPDAPCISYPYAPRTPYPHVPHMSYLYLMHCASHLVPICTSHTHVCLMCLTFTRCTVHLIPICALHTIPTHTLRAFTH
jgi:hypothetical protein